MSELATADQVDRACAAPMPQSEWRRLEIRTILVRPFNEILGLHPAAGRRRRVRPGTVASGSGGASASIVLLLGRGLLHWLTTRYRITDEQVELRTGLVFRQRLATRRERIRTVESTAKFGHRLFGVTSVRIGTGQHEQKTTRRSSWTRSPPPRPTCCAGNCCARTVAPAAGADAAPDRQAPAEVIAALDWRWLRYAPLTLSGLFAESPLRRCLAWRSLNELDINVSRHRPGAQRRALVREHAASAW